MASRKRGNNAALELLVDSGVVNRNATLKDLMELSSTLEDGSGDLSDEISAWSFIVKGKFIFKDDETHPVNQSE